MSRRGGYSGPLGGEARPVHGGRPGVTGCNGCVDCCHLPEISVTDEEALALREVHASRQDEGLAALELHPDPEHEGWQLMRGPCVFRTLDEPLARGGCSIYDVRPTSCRIFSCRLLLDLRRASRT